MTDAAINAVVSAAIKRVDAAVCAVSEWIAARQYLTLAVVVGILVAEIVALGRN